MHIGQMTVGGADLPPRPLLTVFDPATGRAAGSAPDASREDIDAAFAAAAGAFPAWSRDLATRRGALKALAEVLEESADALGGLLLTEKGTPRAECVEEVEGCALWLRHFADHAFDAELSTDEMGALVEIHQRPLGVVAAIAPWNFPLLLAAWKLAPALLAGNTVVLKPSPFTPLATLQFGVLARRVLPPGVLNVISGGDEVGAMMTSHPVPRKVSFTGSIETGKLIAAASAPDLKRLTLELGGNDAAIVLDDADVEAVADGVFWGAFANSGQVCSAIKRVYVTDANHDTLVDALVARARNTVCGDGRDPRSQLGPVSTEPQLERLVELTEDAIARGAKAVIGGHRRAGDGYFFEPTILVDAVDGMPIVDEEQFGPVLPIIRVSDAEEALARANSTQFGLSGSVWGTDPARLFSFAERMQCGTSWINTHLMVGPSQPFGGVKWSGIGVENGAHGLREFTTTHVVYRPAEA
ncbi:aldehyde dehydrogenase family protein [Nocardioides sp.]|uniref:aldehyde dehydrogenase family protein n=1 Tax=Nocardioides sp. TaxID=35761 RepID=UPI003D1180B1